MAANRQTDIYTHVRNAVTLVWGLLRLAPIIIVGGEPDVHGMLREGMESMHTCKHCVCTSLDCPECCVHVLCFM